MARRPAASAQRPGPSLPHRGFALLVLLLAAAGVYHLANLPLATAKVGEASWTAERGESLSLVLAPSGSAPTPLFTLKGPEGGNLSVSLSSAVIGPGTPPEVTEAGAPRTPQPVVWVMDKGGHSRAMASIAVKATGPAPTVTLTPTGDADLAQLELDTRNAALQFDMHGAVTDEPNNAAARLLVGDPARSRFEMDIPDGGALRIPATAEPESEVVILYPRAGAPEVSYELEANPEGHVSTMTALPVTALRLGAPGAPDRLFACGGDPGIYWRGRDLDRIPCKPNLDVTAIRLTDAGVTLTVKGVGFLAKDGEPERYPLERLRENWVISAFLGVVFAALAGWVYRTIFAPLGGASAGPSPRSTPKKARR